MRRFGTPSCLIAAALSVVLAPIQQQLRAELDPAPTPVPAPATQPAASQPADIRLNFRDSPLDVVLKHLSEVAGFQVIEDVPVEAEFGETEGPQGRVSGRERVN